MSIVFPDKLAPLIHLARVVDCPLHTIKSPTQSAKHIWCCRKHARPTSLPQFNTVENLLSWLAAYVNLFDIKYIYTVSFDQTQVCDASGFLFELALYSENIIHVLDSDGASPSSSQVGRVW